MGENEDLELLLIPIRWRVGYVKALLPNATILVFKGNTVVKGTSLKFVYEIRKTHFNLKKYQLNPKSNAPLCQHEKHGLEGDTLALLIF